MSKLRHIINTLEVAGSTVTNPMTAAGDIIYGGVDGVMTRLEKGIESQVIGLIGGVPTWTNAAPGIGLTQDTTVNISAGSTSAQIQTIIDAQPKNLDGNILTFQFADGTYNLSSALRFEGFVGGRLNIYGNTSEGASLHTNQAVHLDGSSWAGTFNGLLYVNNCSQVIVSYLKITIPNIASAYGIYNPNSVSLTVLYNYFLGVAKTNTNAGFRAIGGYMNATANYVSNLNYGIWADRCLMVSNGNASTGTNPNYGLYATNSARIGKNSTQPTGSTANELTLQFGEIGA